MRAPLRVALGRGRHRPALVLPRAGGLVVSTAIDRYVHITVSSRFARRFVLKHLEWEEVDHPRDVRHPILRAALLHHWDGSAIELASVGDAPPGTGLGSSGAYSVCVLAALAALVGPLARARRAGRGRLPPRDRAGRALDRQAGPIRGGLRRPARLRVPPRRRRRRARAEPVRRDARVAARRVPAASSPAGPARRRSSSAPVSPRRRCTGSSSWPARPPMRSSRRPRAPGRADAGALGGQAAALAGDGHAGDGRATRSRAARRRPRRHLAGRGRRRFLLVYSPDPERTRAALDVPELPFGLDDQGCTTLT